MLKRRNVSYNIILKMLKISKKITIIIPVYNGEKYIRRSIDSIISQQDFNFEELEVLLLDDGSKDDSLDILKQYSSEYPKTILATTHKNMGVAKTRDKALDMATGEYVMFIDQDDYIDPDYCARLYRETTLGDYDIVICGFKRPGAGGRIINKHIKLKDSPYAKYVCPGVFPKIHRASFLRKHKIHAFHTVYGEDIGFVLHEYLKTSKIKIIEDYAGYNWVYNDESVSNTLHKQILDVLEMHIIMLDKIKSYDTKTPEHEYYVLQTVIGYLLWAGRSAKARDFITAYREVFAWLDKNYPTIGKNKYVLVGPRPATRLTRFSISIFMVLHKFHLVPVFTYFYTKG